MNLVYFIKDSAFNPELKYSLRSAETNLKDITVWFVGGKPMGLHPDRHLILRQEGKTKWANVAHTIYEFIMHEDCPEEFMLMNDDFFIMEPVDIIKTAFWGSLEGLGALITDKNHKFPTGYVRRLDEATEALLAHNLTTYNFELHRPMPIKRDWMKLVYEKFGENTPCKRSLYGNLFLSALNPVYAFDTKIARNSDPIPVGPYLSTEDSTFENGPVGKLIKETFPNKSRFE